MSVQPIVEPDASLSIRRCATRAAGVVLLALVAACQGQLEPGDVLSGHWINDGASLAANRSSVVFLLPCMRAEFAAIVLGPDRDFSADSRAFVVTGNIIHSPDDRLHIQGRVVGDQVMLELYTIRASTLATDPIAITLTPGTLRSPPVCTA